LSLDVKGKVSIEVPIRFHPGVKIMLIVVGITPLKLRVILSAPVTKTQYPLFAVNALVVLIVLKLLFVY
jgi:hypothetical protein